MSSDAYNAMEDSPTTDSGGINFSGIFGFLFFVTMISGAILMGGRPVIFLNIPSFVMVAGGTGALGLMSYGAKEFFHAVLVLRIVIVRSPRGLLRQRDADILRGLAVFSYASGVIGTMIGAVQILASLDDLSQLGPRFAVALLTVFYAILLSEAVFRPVARIIEDRLRPTP
jgi:flagellar motor component MotA